MADKDAEFRESIFRLASRVKKASLSSKEESDLIDTFNSERGSAEDRAIRAIEKIIGPISQTERRMLEKSAEASANLERLLADLAIKAKEWASRN